jgi:hypothetical protein
MKTSWRSLVLKMLALQVIFLLLHYGYDWFSNSITMVFSGINESIYQHMKVGLFTYLLTSLLEYLLVRKSIVNLAGFVYARLFAATIYPFAIFVFYYMAPAYYGQLNSIPLEVIYANIALLLASFSAIAIERQIETGKPNRLFRVAVIVLFLISLSQYIIFTYRLPWADVFATPPGW